MTYRDDLDAAQSRAAALEAELGRARAERDRVARERDQLAQQLAVPRERVELTPIGPLTQLERGQLVQTLSTESGYRRWSAWIATVVSTLLLIGACVMAGVLDPGGRLGGGEWLVIMALLYWPLALSKLGRTSSSERRQRVLAAIEHVPSEITRVRRVSSGVDSTLLVQSQNGELYVDDSPAVVQLLKRHCPSAQFDG
jgi:hypothetical protein